MTPHDDDDDTTEINAVDLTITWQTLTAVASNYHPASPGAASLIEARRLIEVEVRAQHGDDAWASMVNAEDEDA